MCTAVHCAQGRNEQQYTCVHLDCVFNHEMSECHAYKSFCQRQNIVTGVCDCNIAVCVFGRWVHVLQMAAKAELPSPEKTKVS